MEIDPRDCYIDKDGKQQVEGGDWWYQGEPCFARQKFEALKLTGPGFDPFKCSGFQSHCGLCSPCNMEFRDMFLRNKPEDFPIDDYLEKFQDSIAELRSQLRKKTE